MQGRRPDGAAGGGAATHLVRASSVLLAIVLSTSAQAQASKIPAAPAAPFDVPGWAYPTISTPYQPVARPYDSVKALRVPSSSRSFTLAQVRNQFAAPDWYPGTHPRMPASVANGRAGAVWACAFCHLPDGQGRSENATLAGLPADYIVRQVADFKSGARRSAIDWTLYQNMRNVADSATEREVAEAARYFSRIKAKRRYKVIERSEIPMTYQAGGLYAVVPNGGTEALGNRIIEITENLERHELRDAKETFTAYVPKGSVAAGRLISATVGGTPARACASCHGAGLRGAGVVPPIAGRSPSYLLRQLIAFKVGTRATASSAPMQSVASALDLNDMIAVVAYAGSLRP